MSAPRPAATRATAPRAPGPAAARRPGARAPAPGLAAALLLASGCGYALAAGQAHLPAGAERVFVAPLDDRTPDAEAGALVAAAMRRELARRGAEGGPGSPAVLDGAVLRASFGPTTPQASSYRLVLEVRARLAVEGRTAWERTVRREVDALGEVDALATEGRRRVAMLRAADEVAREIVEGLEAP